VGKNATNGVAETKVDFALMTETEAKMLSLLRTGLKYAVCDIVAGYTEQPSVALN